MATITRAKDLLNNNIKVSVGDIVTINDDNDIVETYVVKDINDTFVTICGIRITEEKDDIIIDEIEKKLNDIIYIGDSFININGYLWKIRERILKGLDPRPYIK